jgi:hypothetical protein
VLVLVVLVMQQYLLLVLDQTIQLYLNHVRAHGVGTF